MISSSKDHYSNKGFKENKTLPINLVNEDMLVEADYVGFVTGSKTDKSKVFEYHMGTLNNAPLIEKSLLSMECEVVDIYDYGNYDNFVLKVVNTYVEETMLDEDGSINYEKIRPVLFEMPTRSYLKMGNKISKCWNIGKDYQIT